MAIPRPYRPIVECFQSTGRSSDFEPSKRLLTVPTAVTATRVPFAVAAARKVILGEKYATPYAIGMLISDMEGVPARFMDTHFPDLQLGSSEFGARADIGADVAASLVLAGAVLLGPKVTKAGKLAVAGVLGKEGTKALWYMAKNKDFKDALYEGELPSINLDIPVDNLGKEAVVEEGIALVCAVATNDVDNPRGRIILSGLALAHSGASLVHGEVIRRQYDTIANEQIASIRAGQQQTLNF